MQTRDQKQEAPFGVLLRQFRIEAGLSQGQLAESARVSLAAISSLERGIRRAPQQQTFDLLVHALRLTPAQRAEFDRAASRVKHRGTVRAATPNNAPTYLTSFVGRGNEIAELSALLERRRLVSIVGAGGIGKTRLACELARTIEGEFEQVCFVDLAPLRDGTAFRSQLAAETGAEMAAGDDPASAIASALRVKRTLLVLDNCEHLVDSVAPMVATLLRAETSVTILATSRERLAVAGETTFRLESLGIESDGGYSPAMRLFIERAMAADPRFVLTEDREHDVLDICRRLDGLPLAIELTAVRLGTFGLKGLRDRLEQQLTLPGALREVGGRHATMQAAIAWSFDALSDHERTILCRLAIFTGGFTIGAVEAVCSDESISADQMLTIITQLLEKSLVQLQHGSDGTRYNLLIGVRLFGLRLLRERGEHARVSHDHAVWLAEIADRSTAQIRFDTSSRPIAQQMIADLENVRSAINRLLSSGEREETLIAARILGGLRTLWIMRGLHDEGYQLADQILQRLDLPSDDLLAEPILRLLVQTSSFRNTDDASQRAWDVFARLKNDDSLVSLSMHWSLRHVERADFERANELMERAFLIFDRNPTLSRALFAYCMSSRSYLRVSQGRIEAARADDAVAAEIGSHANFWYRLMIRAYIEAESGYYALAKQFAEEAIAAIPIADSVDILSLKTFIVMVEEAMGNADTSTASIKSMLESHYLQIHRFLAEVIQCALFTVARSGDLERAAKLMGFVGHVRETSPLHVQGFIKQLDAKLHAEMAAKLGLESYRNLLNQGARLTADQSIRILQEAIG